MTSKIIKGSRNIGALASARESDVITENNLKKFQSKLTKLIPGEIVTGYLFLKGNYEGVRLLAEGGDKISVELIDYCMYGFIVVLLMLTPVLYKHAFGVTNRKQLFLTAIAFVLWVVSIGGPFDLLYEEWTVLKNFITGFLILTFTLIAPLFFDKKES